MREKMQRNSFRFLPLLALLLLANSPASPQSAGTSVELHDFYIGRGFKTDYQGLSPSQSEIYPRNLLVTIPAASREGREPMEGGLENVFLIFPQDDAAAHPDLFLSFLEELARRQLPFTIKAVLAANEGRSPVRDEEGYEHPTGISVFAESLDSGTNSCVIIARSGGMNRISSGGGGMVAPIWLVKSIKTSCEEQSVSAWLPNSASFLYRLGFMSEDEKLSPFLGESIPAAGLYLNDVEDYQKVLVGTLDKLAGTNTSSWDVHYSYVSILSLEFWLDETFFLFCYIGAAFIVLLRLCFSTMQQSDRNRAVIKDLSKAWYLLLLLLAFTAAVLQLSQRIPSLGSPFAAITIGQRLVIATAASLLLFVLLAKLKVAVSMESSARIILLTGACNIFIFSAIDISFLFLFFFEYLACLIARRSKGKIMIITSLIIMALPFIPHAANILLSSNPRSLARLASPGPLGNLLTALILMPFQLQFLRLLMQMDFFTKRKKAFVLLRIFSAALFIAACVACVGLFYFLVIRTLAWASFSSLRASWAGKEAPVWEPRPTFAEDQEADYIRVGYSTDGFMEYNFTSMYVQAAEGVQVLRYDISLETESGIPLNDCNYGYSLSGRHKAYIAVPDNPAADLSIIFTCEKGVSPIAFITSYLKTADGRSVVEKDALNMPHLDGPK